MAYYNQGRYSSPADYWNEQQQSQRSNIQNVLNMIMVMKQHKMNQGEKQRTQAQEQKKWEFEQQKYADTRRQQGVENIRAERSLGSLEGFREAQVKQMERPPVETIGAQRQKYATWMFENDKVNQSEYDYFMSEGTWPKKEGLTTFNEYTIKQNKLKINQGVVKDKLSLYGREIGRLQEPMTTNELIARLNRPGELGDVAEVDTKTIVNLQKGQRVLSLLQMTSIERDWTQEEKRIVAYISGNMAKIGREGIEVKEAKIGGVSTGAYRIKVGGKWLIFKR